MQLDETHPFPKDVLLPNAVRALKSKVPAEATMTVVLKEAVVGRLLSIALRIARDTAP